MNARTQVSLILVLAMLHGGASAQSCVSDRECQDGSWCNGVERCEGGYGKGMCMPTREPSCPAKKACDDVKQQCLSMKQVDEKLTPCPEGEKHRDKDGKCVAESRK